MANSPRPLLTLCDASEIEITSAWKIGVLNINANTTIPASTPKEIHIWNNRGNSTSKAADIVGTYVTTKNLAGDDIDEQVVTDRWVRASCKALSKDLDSNGLLDMTPIGGKDVLNICADVGTEKFKSSFKISGKENEGSYESNNENVATITLQLVPKINALKGLHQFKVRISGYYA